MTMKPGKRKSIARVRVRVEAEDVGYGKPPRASQFKPGRSGNPTGRPKGSKSEASILQELLQHKVALNERGKTRKIILLEAILRKVAEDCLRGNVKSVNFLLNRYYAAAAGDGAQGDISQDDKAVLETFLREFKATSSVGEDES
jgi:Family of unknown function (DUF5681)